jgi:ADP-ribose pyrophosphatase YjhB (NUDIX family)
MFDLRGKTKDKKFRSTARGIIIQDGKLLLLERWRRDKTGQPLHYFSIPGGGVDEGETPEAAVVRELYEEMLIRAKPLRLLARQKAFKRRNYHYYFLCEIVSGEPTFNLDSEEGRFRQFTGNRYAVAWVELGAVSGQIRHDEYRQLIDMLPELLSDESRKTVDIEIADEYTS